MQIYFMFYLLCLEISTLSSTHLLLVGNCKLKKKWCFFSLWILTQNTQFSHETFKCRTQRARPIVVDPGLYLSKKFDVLVTSERRELPTSFKLYTGKLFNIHYLEFFSCLTSIYLKSFLFCTCCVYPH